MSGPKYTTEKSNIDEIRQAVADLKIELDINPMIAQGPLAEEIHHLLQQPTDFIWIDMYFAVGTDNQVAIGKVNDRYRQLLAAVRAANREHGIGVEQLV